MENQPVIKYSLFRATLLSNKDTIYSLSKSSRSVEAWFNSVLSKANYAKKNKLQISDLNQTLLDNPKIDLWDVELIRSDMDEKTARSEMNSWMKKDPHKLNNGSARAVSSKSSPNTVTILKADILDKRMTNGDLFIDKRSLFKDEYKKVKTDSRSTINANGKTYFKVLNNPKYVMTIIGESVKLKSFEEFNDEDSRN